MLMTSLQTAVEGFRCEEMIPRSDYSFVQGNMRSAYWRKRQPMPADPHPDRDHCGVIWLAPVLPMLGSMTAQLVQQVEELMLDHGFEPSISLRLTGGRTIQCMIGLFYERDDEGMDARAAQCHHAVREALYQRGVYPYRLGLLDMDLLPSATDDTEALLRSLKALLDPHGILAPGRYIPS
jgi:4-cresol dehydrogenase (hydroxylating)